MKKKILSLILSGLVLMSIAGCSAEPQHGQLVATTLPIYEFTAELCAGTPLQVTRLITEEISCIHDYSLKVSQLQALEAAELVILTGSGFEAFVTDALPEMAAVLALTELSACSHDHDHGHSHEQHDLSHDPHIWLDPHLAADMCRTICHGLTERYPRHEAVFSENLARLEEKLHRLEQYGQQQLGSLSCRKLITFHDGFSHFAEAFDLEILCAIEEEAGSETSAARLKELVRLVQDEQLPAIFTEENGSDASARIIARETGVKVFSLDMAIAGSSYFDAMYHNIDTVKEALE